MLLKRWFEQNGASRFAAGHRERSTESCSNAPYGNQTLQAWRIPTAERLSRGKIERTLFLLQYISSVELRRRIHVGLNKGEAKNALARAVFFNRLGELRDRTHENQRHRASGLNLVVAAIVLWNTVYLERAVAAIRETGQVVSNETLAHLSPLKWEHINLTGDYHWRKDAGLRNRKLRPLRASKPA